MAWENWYLRFIFLFQLVTADLCPEPTIPNGVVRGEKEQDLFFGDVTCNVGFHLVGSKTIKCRHGDWSQKELPVCSAIGACPTLLEISHGRNVPIQRSRGSDYRFKCNRGFKRFGEPRTHCIGDRWSHSHMPSCTKTTCDVTGMLDIPYGEGRSMMGGAVFKYRCNQGVEMEGSNTLVCDGENWNGTVPHCNVGPDAPELKVIVSGSVVTNVKPGDWVLVTCQAKGGHPLPDIGLTLDGIPSGSKDFRNYKNSFTFTASENDSGKMILCTALNKVGTSVESTMLHVHTPPKNAEISGPKIIHHNDAFQYECMVKGGSPPAEITWTLRDHLGRTSEVKGEMVGPGLSRMELKTGEHERSLRINCLGENSQGLVSHTLHVNTQYLPKSVKISGPTSAKIGEHAHFSCLTSESFPVPAIKWRVETSGNVDEVMDIDGDVSTEALKDGDVVAFAKIDILIDGNTAHTSVQCLAVVDGLGEKRSDLHDIDVIPVVEPIFENDNLKDSFEQNEMSDYSEEDYEDVPEYKEKKTELFELVSLEKIPDYDEEDRSKILWIPIKPVENIQDYQALPEEYDVVKKIESGEDFLRASDIPEATMLKQEKEVKTAIVQSPVSVSTVYSSSTTISIKSMLSVLTFVLLLVLH